jgi:hypothetical protein
MGTLFGLKSTLMLALVAIVAVSLAVVVRNCRKIWEPTPPPHSEKYDVVGVPNGGMIEVKWGPLGKRTAMVWLADISAPPPGDNDFESSRENLKILAGDVVRVETPGRHRIFGDTGRLDGVPVTSEVQPEGTEGTVEARGPIVGVVFGESGTCCNLGQIMDGWASCSSDAPKLWKQEEAKAKKDKRGMWK